jgi:hypothetical protein
MKTQYVTNQEGTKIAALVPIKEYEQLVEDLHDLEMVATRRNDERVSFEEVKRKLIADGILPS